MEEQTSPNLFSSFQLSSAFATFALTSVSIAYASRAILISDTSKDQNASLFKVVMATLVLMCVLILIGKGVCILLCKTTYAWPKIGRDMLSGTFFLWTIFIWFTAYRVMRGHISEFTSIWNGYVSEVPSNSEDEIATQDDVPRPTMQSFYFMLLGFIACSSDIFLRTFIKDFSDLFR